MMAVPSAVVKAILETSVLPKLPIIAMTRILLFAFTGVIVAESPVIST